MLSKVIYISIDSTLNIALHLNILYFMKGYKHRNDNYPKIQGMQDFPALKLIMVAVRNSFMK